MSCDGKTLRCSYDSDKRLRRRTCPHHGPPLRTGPHWYDRKAPLPPSSSPPLPSPAARWAQVLRAAGGMGDGVVYERFKPLTDWDVQLQKALDVEFPS